LFACADSGGWWATTFGQAEECRHLSNFSRLARKSFSDGLSQLWVPTVELGYKFSLDDMGLAACQALTKQAESGIRRLDRDVDVSGPEPSWTVSTALTPRSVAGYLRYGRDVSLPGQTTVGKTSGATKSNPLRVELELCAARFRSSGYLALRALRRIGASSKLGLEVSLAPTTTADVHLSLYWSRHNGQQRLVVPFLATSFTTVSSSSSSFLSPTVVFLAALVPLAGLAAAELLLQWRRKTKAEEKERARTKGKSSPSRDELLQDRVARRRAEADELTALLAGPVAARQGAQRRKGGLVILSAKYGVRDDSSSPSGAPGTATSGGWAADVEEVADVTVAVAALVDDEGALLIPRGVRKARLLGFWDPAPGRAKTLVVRYSHLRSEGIVEVKGSGELRLP
jgi:DnaJ family protein C protein 11